MTMAEAFNEWMRRFIEEPARFSREFEEVARFLDQERQGQAPSYGEECAAYLEALMAEAGR